jgi:hypothetical protein
LAKSRLYREWGLLLTLLSVTKRNKRKRIHNRFTNWTWNFKILSWKCTAVVCWSYRTGTRCHNCPATSLCGYTKDKWNKSPWAVVQGWESARAGSGSGGQKSLSYMALNMFKAEHNPLTNQLTPWSRVLLEKLAGRQLVKKFSAFYGTRRFITAFTRARHLSLSCAISIQSMPPHPTSWRSILILSSHLRLGLLSGSFPQVSPPKSCMHLSHTCYMPRPPHSSRYKNQSRSEAFLNDSSAVRDSLFNVFAYPEAFHITHSVLI